MGPSAGAKDKSPPPAPAASLKGGKIPFAVVPVVVSAEKIQRLVTERVETLRADTLGKLDHAAIRNGGTIFQKFTSSPVLKSGSFLSKLKAKVGFPRLLAHPAEVALSTLNREGECFAFEGGKGRITVDLPYTVFFSSVAVDFVPSAASTPKVFTVHVYEDKIGKRKPMLLGRFEVEVDGSIGDGGGEGEGR